MSDPLFKDTDAVEREFVGQERPAEQPNIPPHMPNPAHEHGMFTTPPARGDHDGIRSEPFFQGTLYGDNKTSAAPQLDTNDEVDLEGDD
ncbi:MAG: hypothetical protein H0T53_03835 [Herpetosiphonaceae bacterium]|nr:hypothetical protein [Herpetosiphonaceae bacterium]